MRHKTILSLSMVSLLAILLPACASHEGASSGSSPNITGVTKQAGVPVPSGRSEGPSMALVEVAPTSDYGYSEKHPIAVGGLEASTGPKKEVLFLNSLRGPEGQIIDFERIGSCCLFSTENSELGGGLLDMYEVTYEGQPEPMVLYFNMYDPDQVYLPVGFTSASP